MNAFSDFVRTPPGWILAILVSYLVVHLIKTARRIPEGNFVAVLDFFVVVVIALLAAHAFIEPTATGRPPVDNPLYFIYAVGGFGLASMILYLIDKKS